MGTQQSILGPGIAIGDERSKLESSGTNLHALVRKGANNTRQAGMFRMHDTATCVANIFSGTIEVYDRHSTVSWSLLIVGVPII